MEGNTLLTDIEIKVLLLICNEYTSKEIGVELGMSATTVGRHRKQIMLKTKSRTVAGIPIYAFGHGLISGALPQRIIDKNANQN